MLLDTLKILRCPFCGGALSVERGESLVSHAEEVVSGIIYCQCSAYPIVAGIPVFTGGALANRALECLSHGQSDQALFTMLGLEGEERQAMFRHYIEKRSDANYREGVELLSSDAEGAYFVYRFSDPTFLAGQTLLRAVGADHRCFAGRAIDICGGSGHLTRVLCQMAGGVETLLADAHFWKLWLAKRFVAPGCQPVCCDANNPLPFARDAFSLVVCSDALHYIWSKRLLASEMMRVAGQEGVITIPHIHNALVENYSAGTPLTPGGWRNLFAELNPRVFKESDLFESALRRRTVDLSLDYSDEELRDEPALFLIATRLNGIYRVYERGDAPAVSGVLSVNPLYEVSRQEGRVILRLQFPSPDYEEEFGSCKRYLPERVEIDADALNDSPASLNGEELRLIESRVLLDLPERY